MTSYIVSFVIYAITVNFVAGALITAGKHKKDRVQWLMVEYFFIYVPWIALILLSSGLLGSTGQLSTDSPTGTFLMVIQSFDAGLLGGFVPAARLVFKAETTYKKLKLTFLSTVFMTFMFSNTRLMLFALVNTGNVWKY